VCATRWQHTLTSECLLPGAIFLLLISNIYLVFAPVVCDVNTICLLVLGKLVYERISSMCVDSRSALPGNVMLPGLAGTSLLRTAVRRF
jgi:hypothetical protein